MPEMISLDAIHVRLLQWLRSYPLQRLEDLVVALGTWRRRTSIYTHLKELEDKQLVETLDMRIYPGKRLYHLTPSGLVWCLGNEEDPAKRMPSLDTNTWRETLSTERTALLRLFPRLPALLIVQTAINGLVSGAASALTQQGHHASLVRWNWQRDVSYPFLFHGRSMRWFVESVGAFCLRFASTEGVQEYWYRFFLLYAPLTHLKLMRARLDRLLRWRESQERWSAYTQMPPILILATTPRQAEWWHEAAERVTHDLEVKRPLGAIATLASTQTKELSAFSPWSLTWKQLGIERACHLQEVFLPQEDPGFPDLFPQKRQAPCREEGRQEQIKLSTRQRHYRFTTLAQQHGKKAGRTNWRADWHLLSLMLSVRQWELLALLLAHPLLDRAALCAHLQIVRSSLRHLLPPLVQIHLIRSYETSVGERFALAEDGLRLMAAASHCHVRYLVHRFSTTPSQADRTGDALIPRGVPGLLKQIEHLAGIYGFTAILAGTGSLRWWETGALCTRLYFYQGDWHGIRPDVIAECQTREDTERLEAVAIPAWRFFLEWDRGTMHEQDLQRKIASYALYYSSREWAREHRVPPLLLFVAPDIGQERCLSRIALAKLRGCPTRVTLYTTTWGLLATRGVTAPIWRRVLPLTPPDPPDGQLSDSSPLRQVLFSPRLKEQEKERKTG